jgi:hypothetical protein
MMDILYFIKTHRYIELDDIRIMFDGQIRKMHDYKHIFSNNLYRTMTIDELLNRFDLDCLPEYFRIEVQKLLLLGV